MGTNGTPGARWAFFIRDGKLQPWVFQIAGIGLLFVFAGFWMATGRKEPELLIAATGLYAYGQAGKGSE